MYFVIHTSGIQKVHTSGTGHFP